MKSIYLAGPMRHLPRYNFDAFDDATDDLRQRGYDVISPAEEDRNVGFDPDHDVPDKEWLQAAMHRCSNAVIDKVDAVACLPGWERSDGARFEVYLALCCGKPVLRYPDLSAIPNSMLGRKKEETVYALSGIMKGGKSYVSRMAGLNEIGFADPIYTICEHFMNTADKTVPGVRKFMQKVGQYGWGKVDTTDDYSWTIGRVLFEEKLKEAGNRGLFGVEYDFVAWNEFGKRKDFWANIVERRIDAYFAEHDRFASDVAIPNVRFEHELQLVQRREYNHYLVDCSPDTQRKRMEAAGEPWDESCVNDTSEQLVHRLRADLAPDHIIWNDEEVPGPEGSISVGEFVERVRESD